MSTRTPLVGRATELARIGEAVEQARGGSGSILLLCGEAGIGKSRLAEEAAGASELVLRGAASEGSAVPYGPIIAALRSRLREDPHALDECGSLLPQPPHPAVRARLPPPPPPPPPPGPGGAGRRERTGDDLRGGPLRHRPSQR